MREYFIKTRVQEFLGRCVRVGVGLWQASGDDWRHWQQPRKVGGEMKYIMLAAADRL